ncbi:MAG: aminoacyl-tRNA hydrolase [Bacteroidetes bacterium]|nr:aminoacyl-tRNA hydrolase [Bacteroidota bacterium]
MTAIRERGLERECSFTAARSSGPGGQNVNKVATKIELAFHVINSQLLSDEEKATISEKLSTKINEDGYLKVSSSESRSQAANKEAALEKLYDTLEKALIKPKKRKPTKMPKAVKEQIKATKRKTSEKKASRRMDKSDWS